MTRPETVEVAVAMLHRQGQWLVQLRDDIEGIVAPGCWGLFGGHLEPTESPEEGLRRELNEELGLQARELTPWFLHQTSQRCLHVFVGPLPVPIEDLHLQEGQDLTLASLEQLAEGSAYSTRLQEARPLAPSLQLVLERSNQLKELS